MLSAVIFDFDGIIVDTEPLHYEAFQVVLRKMDLDYSYEEYEAVYIGFDDRDSFRERLRQAGREPEPEELAGMIREKGEVFMRLAAESSIEPLPGVRALIGELSGTLPLGLCSGAVRNDIEPILGRFGLENAFDRLTTAEDVSRSKPDPASYRLSLEQLGEAHGYRIDPGAAVAIEDTPAGLASARAAGLWGLGVTNTHAEAQLTDACRVVDSLEAVSLDQLRAWLSDGAVA